MNSDIPDGPMPESIALQAVSMGVEAISLAIERGPEGTAQTALTAVMPLFEDQFHRLLYIDLIHQAAHALIDSDVFGVDGFDPEKIVSELTLVSRMVALMGDADDPVTMLTIQAAIIEHIVSDLGLPEIEVVVLDEQGKKVGRDN